MISDLDTIERIEHLITIEEQRLDAVIREIDRRRAVQKYLDRNFQYVEEAEFKDRQTQDDDPKNNE